MRMNIPVTFRVHFHQIKPINMQIRQYSYETSALWRKSEELMAEISTMEPFPECPAHEQFLLLKDVALTLHQDIEQAYTLNDRQIILYHFSKAKSSCQIMEKILSRIEEIFSPKSVLISIRIIEEITLMLNHYIHLSLINITIEKKNKD